MRRFFLYTGLASSSALAGFHYQGGKGTAQWPCIYPMCGGAKQSPINLTPERARNAETNTPLRLYNYTEFGSWSAYLVNNGHTAQVNCETEGCMVPGVKGGPLKGDYCLAQYHFHWGPTNAAGSEHTVCDEYRSMEVHFVHHNRKFPSLKDAIQEPDGVVVISLFLDVVDHTTNDTFENFTKKLNYVVKENSSTEIQFGHATDWYKEAITSQDYYVYKGSLTTPPCCEGVTWIVFDKGIEIHPRQAERFRSLIGQGKNILLNRRPIQPTNNRNVFYISTFQPQ